MSLYRTYIPIYPTFIKLFSFFFSVHLCALNRVQLGHHRQLSDITSRGNWLLSNGLSTRHKKKVKTRSSLSSQCARNSPTVTYLPTTTTIIIITFLAFYMQTHTHTPQLYIMLLYVRDTICM